MIMLLSAFLCLIIILTMAWPLVGELPYLLWNISNLHDYATLRLKLLGGTTVNKCPMFLNSCDYIVTSDPMNARHILIRNFANYEKGEDLRVIMEGTLGEGIFNANGESWRFQRKLIHSLINNKEFGDLVMQTLRVKMQGTLFRVLDDYASGRKSGKILDMQDVAKNLVFDNICSLVFGFDPCSLSHVGSYSKSLSSSELHALLLGKAFDEIEEAVIYRHVVPMWVWKFQKRLQIGVEKKVAKYCKILDEFLYASIEMKKQELSTLGNNIVNSTTERRDLLSHLLVGEEKFSNKFMRDVAISLIVAGRDTVSSALTWLLWLVATHPDVEKRVLEEIKQVMTTTTSSSGGLLSEDELNKLIFLHATICETLRLYPPFPIEHKCAVEADVLPTGHCVRKGTKILVSIYSMGRMEEIWGDNCMEFKPERWISEQGSIIYVPSYKFMAFISGPRTCLGKTMAFMQLKSMASAIMWNYKLDMVEDHVVKPTPSMILSMKHGLKMRVSKRASNLVI
ncbi:unnamed protein product [Linum tenue]|uniref:Cytochrome P450 n=1 Tax=Linum tenue TaxID=586396 RepID=A0AAV0N8Z7_9ROSI|nr:unnamed protein product [Linum tenue]